jgi:hypothetical protein
VENAMKCHNCHKGTVSLLACPGRTSPYKSIPNLPVPADLEIQTCDHCGEEWMTPEDAMRIDAALDLVYRQELLARLQAVLPDAKEASRIERDLGLSRGYLSRLRKTSRPPTEALLAILALFRQHPATLGQVEAFWRQPVER